MHQLILIFVYFQSIVKARSEEALIYNLDSAQLDVLEHRSIATNWNCLTACPASTPQERQINANVSIGGNSVFLREVHRDIDYKRNINASICEEPIKSTTVYDLKGKEYLVGYEFYYEEKKITMEFENYGRFESANDGNDIMSPRQPHNSTIFRYQDGKSIRFFFVDGSPTLVFHWINALTIKCLPHHQKRFNFGTVGYENVLNYPTETCEDYHPEYKEMNFMHPKSNHTMKDFFRKRQIVPIWYFVTNSTKLATCSYANIIPVWKDFVDKQLKKVDLYIYTVARYFKREFSNIDVQLDFGVSDQLTVKLSGSGEPQEIVNVHLTDSQNRRNITIPRIIYRIIRCKITTRNNWYIQSAAVIIHNDHTPILQSDRLCKERDELRGWDKIKNNVLTAGLTYVCPVSKELDDRLLLGLLGVVSNDELFGLNLGKVPSNTATVLGTVNFVNMTDGINKEFEKIV